MAKARVIRKKVIVIEVETTLSNRDLRHEVEMELALQPETIIKQIQINEVKPC